MRGHDDYPAATEYVVITTRGDFQTGGFESAESLRSLIQRGNPVDGTFIDATNVGPAWPWHETCLNPDHVVAIVDVRGERA